MAASSRAAVLQSPGAGACPAEAACRSLGAACQVGRPAAPRAAFVAARVPALLQQLNHTCNGAE